MNSPDWKEVARKHVAGNSGHAALDRAEFEDTLRLIAHLPAPQGLEERVRAGLEGASRAAAGGARILRWPQAAAETGGKAPGAGWRRSPLARGAAAAAIVLVVAGGGWSVSSRVEPSSSARIAVPPARAAAAGKFSSAGAIRTPQTLNGPLVTPPATAAARHPAKAAGRTATQAPARRGSSAAAQKTVTPPAASPAR